MNALQEQADGRLNRFIESHDPISFFRPEDLFSADPPAEAPHVTEPLGLSQIRLATLQRPLGLANALFRLLSFGVLSLQRFVEVFELLNGRPQIVARESQRFRRAPLRDADPNHEKRRHGKKGEARYVLSDKRIRCRNEIVIESQNGESGCEQAGPAPPSHAANKIAHRNKDTNGTVCRNLSSNNPATAAAATARTATA